MAWGNASMGSYSLGTRDVLTEFSPDDQAMARIIIQSRPDVLAYFRRGDPNISEANAVNNWAFGKGWKQKGGVGEVAQAGGLLNLAKAYGWKDTTPTVTFADGTVKTQAEMGSELFKAGWGGENGSVLQNNGTNMNDILTAYQRTSGRQVQAAPAAPAPPTAPPAAAPPPMSIPNLPGQGSTSTGGTYPSAPPSSAPTGQVDNRMGMPAQSPTGPLPPVPGAGDPTPTLERDKLSFDIWRVWQQLRIAEQQGNAQLAQQLTMQMNDLQFQREQLSVQEGISAGGLTGYYGGNPTLAREQQAHQQQLDMAALRANPRNFVEAFLAGAQPTGMGAQGPMGTSPQQVGSWLQRSAPVQQAFQQVGLQPQNPVQSMMGGGRMYAGGTPNFNESTGQYTQQPSSGMVDNRMGMPQQQQGYSGGTNPLFSYVSGRHQNVREWDRMAPTQRAVTHSLASFSGQDPADWDADRERARPKGMKAGPTRFG